jgi:hypothetical protein
MSKAKESQHEQNTQVTFRLPVSLRAFYEEQAKKERRRLSDMFRIALEDQAEILRPSSDLSAGHLRT